ncbi:A/G-specific adenine glycosylase [Niabella beijingensis]|uniref:A/G-specific adenine glycosylase n=1 Tax=Niabella beijingensis TaxID=2872700 RepID=UPI001CBBF399|nr:A/G-specific adenine glycosylase [Niabella beijingensis]MBZ4189721.1 A/G-specific adenine glycosylase [Niabella beijingensis]
MIHSHFSQTLLFWNRTENKRIMPWKGIRDPYKIWLSEIILQQTRVDQGLKYYENFITRFPSVDDLARAEDQEVFKLWEGLGYYSRCKNLILTARKISFERNGRFPDTYEEILKLKGIGPYTAAAIASFAFRLPHAVIDGNVFRVLARIFGIREPIDTTAGKKQFTTLANQLLDKKNPGIYNQAIMDFGAVVCKPAAPECEQCPFNTVCVAYKKELVNLLPVKVKKTAVRTRYFYFFLPAHRNTFPVRERLNRDIWQHLYEFPLIEAAAEMTPEALLRAAVKNGWLEKGAAAAISPVFTQKLSHQLIKSVFVSCRLRAKGTGFNDYRWVKKDLLQTLPFPKTITRYLDNF